MALFYYISTRFQYGTRTTKGQAMVGYIPGHLQFVVQGYPISEPARVHTVPNPPKEWTA